MITIHELPALRLLISMVIGIVIAPYLPYDDDNILYISGAIIILLSFSIYFLRFNYRLRAMNSILQIFTGSLISIFLITLSKPEFQNFHITNSNLSFEEKTEFFVQCTDPAIRKNSWQIPFEIKAYRNNPSEPLKRLSGKILLFSKELDTVPRPGETYMINVKLVDPQPSLNPHSFNYADYLKNQGILKTGFFSKNDLVKISESPWYNIKNFTLHLRNILIDRTRQLIGNNEEADVSAGLLFGYRDDIDEKTETQFVQTGAVHLLAVSGMHVILIFSNLKLVLRLLRINKFLGERWMSLLALFLIWIFTFLAGLAPSIVRASIMLSVLIFGEIIKKSANSINVVSAGAALMLIYDPLTLYDVGFQLSFAAVIGIIQLQKPVRSLFPAFILRSGTLTDLMAVTIAAQIGTLPLILFYFHQFPVYFVLTGIVAVIISDWIIKLASVILITSFISFEFAAYFSLAWKFAVQALLASVEWISFLPGGLIEGIYFDMTMAIIISLLIILSIINMYNKIKYMSLILICGVISILFFDFKSIAKSSSSSEIISYSHKRGSIIEIRNGLKSKILADNNLSDDDIKNTVAGNHLVNRIDEVEIIKLKTSELAVYARDEENLGFNLKIVDDSSLEIVQTKDR